MIRVGSAAHLQIHCFNHRGSINTLPPPPFAFKITRRELSCAFGDSCLSVAVHDDGTGLGEGKGLFCGSDALDNCWDNGREGHLSVISGLESGGRGESGAWLHLHRKCLWCDEITAITNPKERD